MDRSLHILINEVIFRLGLMRRPILHLLLHAKIPKLDG